MTVYIIQNNFYELFSSFTNHKLADEECASMNESADHYVIYSVIELELVTDAFMELTLQPPNSKILSETVTAIVSDWNTIEPRFKLFGGTSGSLKYFTKVKPGTKLQITIKELK